MTPRVPITVENSGPGTGYGDALSNTLRVAQDDVFTTNTKRKQQYEAAVKDYNDNMEAGNSNPNLKPPTAPPLAVLDPPDTNNGGVWGWIDSPTEKITTDLVIDSFNHHATVGHPPQMVIHLGHPISGAPGWWSIGPDDTWPDGMVTPPQPDGHTYLRVYSGMGTNVSTGIATGWYLQQS